MIKSGKQRRRGQADPKDKPHSHCALQHAQRVVLGRKGTRLSCFWEPHSPRKRNRKGTVPRISPCWVCPETALVAQQILPSVHALYFRDSPLLCATHDPSPLPPSTLLTCLYTAHPLVVAVPVEFNVVQVGCMHNDISILLYQLRISGQLFLKEKRR